MVATSRSTTTGPKPAEPATDLAEQPSDLTAVQAARRVARLFPEVYRRYHWANRVHGADLPVTRRALEVLQHLGAGGPLTVGEQAEHMGLRRNSVSELLQRLEAQGARHAPPRRARRASSSGLADRSGARRRLEGRSGAGSGPHRPGDGDPVPGRPRNRRPRLRIARIRRTTRHARGRSTGRPHSRKEEPVNVATNCESCGMPLAGAEDHALSDAAIPYCSYCAPEGKLQPAEERLERFTQWTMRQDGLDYAAAREKARSYMRTMPAWKDAF